MHDLINAAFEFGGIFAVGLSVRMIMREKKVHGISWAHVAFFCSWGVWNLAYYPHLGQWWSFAAGIGVCLMNVTYLGLVVHYRIQQTKGPRELIVDWDAARESLDRLKPGPPSGIVHPDPYYDGPDSPHRREP